MVSVWSVMILIFGSDNDLSSIHLLYPFIHCIHSSNSFIHPYIHPFIPIEADCLLLLCNCHEANHRGCGQQSGGQRLVSHPFREHRSGRVRRYNPGRAAIVVQHWTGDDDEYDDDDDDDDDLCGLS